MSRAPLPPARLRRRDGWILHAATAVTDRQLSRPTPIVVAALRCDPASACTAAAWRVVGSWPTADTRRCVRRWPRRGPCVAAKKFVDGILGNRTE